MKKIFSFFVSYLVFVLCGAVCHAETSIKILQFNVWKEASGVPGGFDAVVDAIIQSGPDIVSLNEVADHSDMSFTQKLARALKEKGYDYNTFRSETSGIISKYPISETAVIFPKKKINKAVIQTPDGNIAVYSTHLDHLHYACYYPRGYDGNSWKKMGNPITDSKLILADTLASDRPRAIRLVIEDAKKEIERGNCAIIAGDFNEPSHRDWVESTKNLFEHNGAVVPWPTTKALEENGFVDAYRKKFPNPVTHPGFTFPANNPAVAVSKLTWAPDADERERIDFIFYASGDAFQLKDVALFGPKGSIVKNKRVECDTSDKIIEPQKTWPSDHNAVLATFIMNKSVSRKK